MNKNNKNNYNNNDNNNENKNDSIFGMGTTFYKGRRRSQRLVGLETKNNSKLVVVKGGADELYEEEKNSNSKDSSSYIKGVNGIGEAIDPHSIKHLKVGLHDLPDRHIAVKRNSECAFGILPLSGSICSGPEELKEIKQFYKKKIASNTILDNKNYNIYNIYNNNNNQSQNSEENELEIIEKVKKALNCSTESCIYKNKEFQDFIGYIKAKNILENRFLTVGPYDSTELLSNRNIEGVLKQFTAEFPDFVHIPFQMIDFLQTNTELARLDILSFLKKGYRRFGVVLNTDVSTGKGKHWFCLYLDFSRLDKAALEICLKSNPTQLRCTDKCTLEYFNSSGNPARPQIAYWCQQQEKRLRKELPGLNLWIIQSSQLRHQWSHTECGMYALFYIWQRSQGRPFIDFTDIWVTDEQMIQTRSSFFRPA